MKQNIKIVKEIKLKEVFLLLIINLLEKDLNVQFYFFFLFVLFFRWRERGGGGGE